MIIEVTWQNGQVQSMNVNSDWNKLIDLCSESFDIYLRERDCRHDVKSIHNLRFARTIQIIEDDLE